MRFRVETIPLCDDFPVSEERSFLNSVVEYFRSTSASMIIPAANTALFRICPDGSLAAPYGTVVNDLAQPEAGLWKSISEAYRKDIRRATNSGVHVDEGIEHLETAYAVFSDTMKRSHERAKALAEIKTLVCSLGDHARVFVAIYEGAVQASLIMAFSDHTAYTLYGGTVERPTRGAMHLLHWEAMRKFRELGVKRFNFSGVRMHPDKGSKQEGILTFKTRFGGQLIEGYMWKYPLRRLPTLVYTAGMRMLRGGDVVDLEHHKLSPCASITSGPTVTDAAPH